MLSVLRQKKEIPEGGFSNSAKEKSKEILPVLGIQLGIIIVMAAVILFVLNYFNAFSLATMYPGIFGFLPRQKASVGTIKKTSSSIPNQKITLSITCPIPRDQCSGGSAVTDNKGAQKLFGVRFQNVKKGSEIIASIGGKHVTQTKDTFTITSASGGIEVWYVVNGEYSFDKTAISSSINEGQIIGKMNGSVNTLTIYAKSILTKAPIRLELSKSGNYLTSPN